MGEAEELADVLGPNLAHRLEQPLHNRAQHLFGLQTQRRPRQSGVALDQER